MKKPLSKRRAATRAYFDQRLGRTVWNDEPEYDNPNDRPRTANPHGYVAPDGCYVDFSLPRWSKEHKAAGGKFTKDGKCVMTGRRQIERTMDVVNADLAEFGREMTYDRPFYRR